MVNKARIFRSTAPALLHVCNRSARAVTQQTSEPISQINFSMFVSLDSNRSNESPLIASAAMSTTIRAGVLSLSRSRIKLDFVDKVNRLTSTNSKFLPSPPVCAPYFRRHCSHRRSDSLVCSQRRRRGSRRSSAGPSAHRPPSLRSRFARLGVQARRIGNSRPLSCWHRCRRAALRLEGEAGREAQIFVVVRRPGGGECVAAHDPRDRFGVLVIVRVPSVRHAAEGRHVDWIPVGTTSSVSAAVLAVRLLTSRVRSSFWVEAPCRSTEGYSTNFATCVSCRKVRLPHGLCSRLPRGL